MKKYLLITLLAGFTSFTISAQELGKHEISVSYGFAPVSEISDAVSDVAMTLGSMTVLSTDNGESLGALNIGYLYHLSDKLAVGGTYTYSSSTEDVNFRLGSVQVSDELKRSYHSVMANAKYTWHQGELVRWYSKIGAGVLMKFESMDDYDENETYFSYQVSPVGVEVGEAFAGFAELGYGQLGILQFGVRCRF